MQPPFTKKNIGIAILIVVAAIGAIVYFVIRTHEPVEIEKPLPEAQVSAPEPEIPVVKRTEVGFSVEERSIDMYSYGTGDTHLLFVGGIHGGYEWNSVLLAYQFMDYLETNPDVIPEGITVDVIPSANPDGLFAVIGTDGRFALADVPLETDASGTGRFNANDVDLNRNFDCKWKPESTWRSKVVSAGTAAFSEPEAQAIKNAVEKTNPKTVVFWHSQSNAVYASECENGILPVTLDVMNEYAAAAGYSPVSSFDAYPITGDAEGWLASIGIPAITVELKTHETVEWDKNILGIKALFAYFK